jgi:hypothetical protein
LTIGAAINGGGNADAIASGGGGRDLIFGDGSADSLAGEEAKTHSPVDPAPTPFLQRPKTTSLRMI